MSTQHAVVIGSGFGGLAAAVRLRARGYRVTVLEAGDQPGGRARVFERDGYRFDAGPTVVTAHYLFDELFELVGRNPADYYELIDVDPFYRVKFEDGTSFDYVGDEERLLENIRQLNPRDVDNYRSLLAMSQRIFEVGYEQLADTPFDRLTDMLRIVPQMLKLKSYQSVYGMVASHLEDPRLRQVFTFQPLLVGGNPFDTPSIYLLIHWLERKWGVQFPRGGTSSLVNGLVRLLDELDVPVRTNAAVARIETASGRTVGVELEDGERIAADLVIANADPSTVYAKLLEGTPRSVNTDGRVGRVRQSMSLFVTYLGSRVRFPDTAHHTILLGPRYKGLLDDIFHKRVLADDFSLYLHAPSRTDPAMAPPGRDAFYVLSPVPNLRGNIDWERMAAEYEARIVDYLDRTELKGIASAIDTKFSVDPRYFAGPLRSVDGAAFGPEPRLTQSAWFRYHNRSEDVDGLYFVGAGTHPGAGMPGVLSSARVLDRVVPDAELPIPLPMPARRSA